MTPKEKAKNLVNKFYIIIPLDKMDIDYDLAKQFALIAVDQIIEELPEGSIDYGISARRRFFEEVKQEIEKL